MDPNNAGAHYNLAMLLQGDRKDYPAAEAEYLARLEITPADHDARYWLAAMLGPKAGRWADAARHMRLAADGGHEKAAKEVAEYEAKAK